MEPVSVCHSRRHFTKQMLIEEELKKFRLAIDLKPVGISGEVWSMLSYVHENLFDPMLNVNAVKARCGIRNHNVATRFRGSIGMGVRDYIEWLRMQAALRLLVHHDLEVFLIGLAVGYSYQESFCRTFHRIFGCTPSEYRLRGMRLSPSAYHEEGVLRTTVKS
jgi:AraC-like DNA-binding protein